MPLSTRPHTLSQKQRKFLESVESFCQELRPLEELCYLEHKYNDQLIPLARKYNLLGILVDKKYGGLNIDLLTYIRAIDRISKEGSGVRTFFSVHVALCQLALQHFGTESLKQKYLKPSTTGKCILAYALTEPNAGSNPLQMETTYEKKGNHYILNGIKYLISNSGIADAIIVFAYPKKPSKGQRRISAFVIDAKEPTVLREDLHAKMGTPTCNTGMFEMKNHRIPATNLLGKLHDGWNIAKTALLSGRLSVGAGCLGIIEDCLDEVLIYAKERNQHGKPIAKHQLIQEHIAEIKIALDTSRALIYQATLAKLAFDKHPQDKVLFRQADMQIAEAKLYAARMSCEAADHAVQILGGRGWSFLYRSGRHFVDSRVHRIYEGTEEILKLKIAMNLLGKEYKAFS